MAAKIKTQFSCQNCGSTSPKWLGRCPTCESWNSFVEETVLKDKGGEGSALSQMREEFRTPGTSKIHKLEDISENQSHARYTTNIEELDRVLSGGLVPDAFTLLGGDPGIGKSTLILQVARGLIEKQEDLRILYVSGEESVEQIRSRAKRLKVPEVGRIFLAAETSLERALAMVHEVKPTVLMIDSLQTFTSSSSQSAPGSVSQVREISSRLMALAKSARIAVWLIGHVTKDGSIAGPKTIEHMVDTVLYFEGDGSQSYRLLRTVKNRFGSTHELGVFEMDVEGLREVKNPSSLFLGERAVPVEGVAVTASIEGTRPLLIEVQALVSPTTLPMPRRVSVGLDAQRLAILSAILERHLGTPLAVKDLFFNVSGGFHLSETASDLAVVAAIYSSIEGRAYPSDWLFLGEVSLTGELRRIPLLEPRIMEARKLGFKRVFIPRNSEMKDSLKKIPIQIERLDHLREFKKYFSANESHR